MCNGLIDLPQARAESESGVAAALVGLTYMYGCGVPVHHSTAVRYFERAMDCRYVRGAYLLGNCYEHGEGFEKNAAKVVDLYQQSAEGGDGDGMIALALAFQYRKGVFLWICPRQHPSLRKPLYAVPLDVTWRLGWMYKRGEGVEKDETKAMWLYKQATDGGDEHGMVLFGLAYKCGLGVGLVDVPR